jgi:GTPase SAR1 family protein
MSFSIAVIGPRGSGKTSFIERYTTGNFECEYNPSFKNKTNVIELRTNYKNIVIKVIDAQEMVEADSYIVMSSVDDEEAELSLKAFTYPLPHRPTVLVMNKIDIHGWSIPREITVHKELKHDLRRNFPIEFISVKSYAGIDKPFNDILRILTGRDDLSLI